MIPIQVELYAETLLQIQKSALEKVKETGIKGMLIDVSAVEVIDSFLGKTLSDTARMASLLGVTTVFTGFKPGVVAALVDLDVELGDIQTAIDLEQGFQKLKPIVEPQELPEEIEEFPEAPDEEEPEDET